MSSPFPLLCRALLPVLGLFLGLVSARAATTESAMPRFALYERYLAIDNSCGWPLLTTLPGGDLACFIWPQPTHSLTEGAVECWLSHDQGRNWERAGIPAPYAPTTNRMNHAAGVAPDGSLVALIAGWNHRKPIGWKPDPTETRSVREMNIGSSTLKALPAVSRDGGHTWKQFPEVTDPTQPETGFTPFGRIAPLADGQLGVMMYAREVAFFTSADGGATWKKRGILATNGDGNETTWLRLANGDLYAALRTTEDRLLQGFRSTDSGATWKFERELTLPMEHPADLTTLPDGRILLSYGVRTEGNWGIALRFADAAARTWSPPMTLVDLEGSTDQRMEPTPARDGGYPSTVVLPDGTFVTAYYSRGIPAHNRYHVGIVRWRLAPPGKSFVSRPKE